MVKSSMLIPYTHDDLIARGVKWLQNQKNYLYRSPIIVTEFSSMAEEIPDILGMNHFTTTLIECKTSLEDFKADANKAFRNIYVDACGTFRFYLCAAGLIPEEKIPEDWGLLYCYPNQIKIIKIPVDHDKKQTRFQEYCILYSLVRRAMLRGFDPNCKLEVRKEVKA